MRNVKMLLNGSMLGAILALGLAMPAFAQPQPSDTTTAPAATPAATQDINFGDDSNAFANDGECDDPRFKGTASAAELFGQDIAHDATDCRTALEAGTVEYIGEDVDVPFSPQAQTAPVDTPAEVIVDDAVSDFDFGDDTSYWANNDECDDPRFEGSGVASELLDDDIMHDATDCRTAFDAGTITVKEGGASITAAVGVFDYGTDLSRWANDGECDDKRFTGEGVDKKLLAEDVLGDATDCRALVESGSISIRPVYDPAYAAGAPYDSKGIDFGDNRSDYADDSECDDPRFEGPGSSAAPDGSDFMHDRSDCKAAFEAGTVVLL